MRWVLLGRHVHAVSRASGGKTLCGKSLRTAKISSAETSQNRCCHCDRVWREKGRAEKAPTRVDKRAVYTPRYTFRDWEDAPPRRYEFPWIWEAAERDA